MLTAGSQTSPGGSYVKIVMHAQVGLHDLAAATVAERWKMRSWHSLQQDENKIMSNRWMLRNVEAFSILYFFWKSHKSTRSTYLSGLYSYAICGGRWPVGIQPITKHSVIERPGSSAIALDYNSLRIFIPQPIIRLYQRDVLSAFYLMYMLYYAYVTQTYGTVERCDDSSVNMYVLSI